MRTDAAVTLFHTGVKVDLDNGNLCVNCHQSRPVSPMPVVGGANVNITSSRWGPHHGAQGNMVWGVGAYPVPGALSYPAAASNPHAMAGCTTCHMAEPYAASSGGHTFKMSYKSSTGSTIENTAGCKGCHTGITSFDLNGRITEIEDLTEELREILVTRNFINDADDLVKASTGSPLNVSPDVAGAILNYVTIYEDQSNGMHNPAYTKALLVNSIAVFDTK